MSPEEDDFTFVPPPEAPVFEPSEEEFKDPLAFIAKIRPYAEKTGICKIRPPPDWQPSFCVDVGSFRFTPRIQKLNELEAKSRVRLNFLDSIAKFWELQGATLKLPIVDKKPLDLFLLHKTVQEEDGFEDVTRKRKWQKVAQKMGYVATPGKGLPMLRNHYEKILFPYDVFLSGAMIGDNGQNVPETKEEVKDEDYVPSDGDEQVSTRASRSRMGRGRVKQEDITEEIDYNKNPELKKLKFLAPGPKITGSGNDQAVKPEPIVVEPKPKRYRGRYDVKSNIREVQELTRRRPARTTRDKQLLLAESLVDQYKCQVCDKGDSEESMLLCDGCDSSYHTFCLIPPLTSVPPGDWRCPKCVAQECKKRPEAYGFEQAKKEYSLREFGVMADKFKEEYFGVPPHEVPPEVVEHEFWRLTTAMDDDVVVEYGADLSAADYGSGFPTRENTDDPDDEDYIKSYWNLNNLPIHEKSILRFINVDISGMKVPWIYVGMCFSNFCWHTEDHWSYSINYLHWGEPKTWYGVPEEHAEKLEGCMKETAPELFEAQPDLLHHLVTIISPNALMNYGVNVVRTNQYAGEFVVTFPRAYHAGFNQGYNCAEAVNFCPADWLPMGRRCVDHYRNLQRCPVFSHEELVCKVAIDPESLDLELAKAVYIEMEAMVNAEVEKRIELRKKGVIEAEREAFELLPDDERKCAICKSTCFFSAVSCSCNPDAMSCLYHTGDLCSCGYERKAIRYRYTLEELPNMLQQLKKRADSFDNWCKEAEATLHCSPDDKKDLSELKELVNEAEQNQFPPCELLDLLKGAVTESEQCAQVATQLFIKKHKTRKVSSSGATQGPKLTLQELKDFVLQVQNLPCLIKEARLVQGLMTQVENFQYETECVLKEGCYDIKRLNELMEHGNSLEIELPELASLKLELRGARWLEKVKDTLGTNELITLDTLRTLVEQGMKLNRKPALEKPMRQLKELLYNSDRWEEKAKLCLQAKPRHMISTLESIVHEASKINTLLPNVNALKEALKRAHDWSNKVDRIQNDETPDTYPYFDVLEALVMRGRPIPVRLEQLPQMESQVAAAKAWKDRTIRTFVKKGSTRTLLELLAPRKDIGQYKMFSKPKKKRDKEEKEKDKKEKDREREQALEAINLDEYVPPDPKAQLVQFKEDEKNELDRMRIIRQEHLAEIKNEIIEGPYCVCRKGVDGFMLRCNLCLDWFHSSCVPLPKTGTGKPLGKGHVPWQVSREIKYLCPLCHRSRRPRLETILSLLVSLQKLPVRLPEGEALQYLTERAMNWQDRAKQILEEESVKKILRKVSLFSGLLSDKPLGSTNVSNLSMFIQRKLNANRPEEGALKPESKDISSANENLQSRKDQIKSIVKEQFPKEPLKEIAGQNVNVVAEGLNQIQNKKAFDEQEDSGLSLTLECDEKMADNGAPISPEKTTGLPVVLINTAKSLNQETTLSLECTEKPSKEEQSPTLEISGKSSNQQLVATDVKPADHATLVRSESTEKSENQQKEVTEHGMSLDLECTEQMTESPKSSKDAESPSSMSPEFPVSTPKQSRPQSPIDVITPVEVKPENIKMSSEPMKPVSQTNSVPKLEGSLVETLEELLMEGDLLEISLDESQQLWAVLQSQKPLLPEDCKIMDPEYRKQILKERKKRKRKLEDDKKSSSPRSSSPTINITKATKPNHPIPPELKKAKPEPKPSPVQDIKDDEIVDVEEPAVEEYDEDCAAKPCKQPLGDEVGWVQCDRCCKWYHVICVGISQEDADNMDTYNCPTCVKSKIKKKQKVEKKAMDLKNISKVITESTVAKSTENIKDDSVKPMEVDSTPT